VSQPPRAEGQRQLPGAAAQIEGTENRINVERNKFNGLVNDYNAYIVPSSPTTCLLAVRFR
jgi:LemA protein